MSDPNFMAIHLFLSPLDFELSSKKLEIPQNIVFFEDIANGNHESNLKVQKVVSVYFIDFIMFHSSSRQN